MKSSLILTGLLLISANSIVFCSDADTVINKQNVAEATKYITTGLCAAAPCMLMSYFFGSCGAAAKKVQNGAVAMVTAKIVGEPFGHKLAYLGLFIEILPMLTHRHVNIKKTVTGSVVSGMQPLDLRSNIKCAIANGGMYSAGLVCGAKSVDAGNAAGKWMTQHLNAENSVGSKAVNLAMNTEKKIRHYFNAETSN